MKPKTVLAFDLDGTLTKRNTTRISPDWLVEVLNQLDELGHFSLPVTGKPAAYALRTLRDSHQQHRGVVAENAGVYVPPGHDQAVVFGSNQEAVEKLRTLLGITQTGVTHISLAGQRHEVVIDPEDVSILTIFSRADTVTHRWLFNPTIGTAELYGQLLALITEHHLDHLLQALPPFPDGGIQVIRRNTNGTPVDKALLPQAVAALYSTKAATPIAMFGDGHNDIPAMKPEGIIPITFANAEDAVRDYVKLKGGYITPSDAPEGRGVADGLLWLAQREFFGPDSQQVESIVRSSMGYAKK
jgi:hydroxymethylpyrimidine pyrophosphatase-like HAD family hydrolase